MKEIIQAAAGGGLLRLHGADLGHAGGEEFLLRKRWSKHSQTLEFCDVDTRHYSTPTYLCKLSCHIAAVVELMSEKDRLTLFARHPKSKQIRVHDAKRKPFWINCAISDGSLAGHHNVVWFNGVLDKPLCG